MFSAEPESWACLFGLIQVGAISKKPWPARGPRPVGDARRTPAYLASPAATFPTPRARLGSAREIWLLIGADFSLLIGADF